MQISLINKGTTGELLINGRIDSATAPQLEKLAEDLIPRFNVLIFNLAGLEYTSSAGLRIIIKMHNGMIRKGGNFYLKEVRPAVMEVLELTGFESILNFM